MSVRVLDRQSPAPPPRSTSRPMRYPSRPASSLQCHPSSPRPPYRPTPVHMSLDRLDHESVVLELVRDRTAHSRLVMHRQNATSGHETENCLDDGIFDKRAPGPGETSTCRPLDDRSGRPIDRPGAAVPGGGGNSSCHPVALPCTYLRGVEGAWDTLRLRHVGGASRRTGTEDGGGASDDATRICTSPDSRTGTADTCSGNNAGTGTSGANGSTDGSADATTSDHNGVGRAASDSARGLHFGRYSHCCGPDRHWSPRCQRRRV